MCTFHFSSIGEVMLTPYDFSVITGLRLGGERIRINNFLTLKEIKSLLGVVPSKMRSKNVPLMCLYENTESYKTVAMGTCMFMLLFIRSPNFGSAMNLRYLWSLRDIDQIKNYDWGFMAYATLLYFMTQLSKRSLSSLRGAPFVWQVGFGFFFFFLCVGFGKLFWLGCNSVVNFFKFRCMNTLGLVLKFKRRLIVFILDFSIGFQNIVCQCSPGVLWMFSVC